jgi:hypothetical protein
VLLSERFTASEAAPAAPAQPPPSGGPRGPGRLPVSTTSLIGRERAIGEVARLLGRAGARLVTLTGPGGVGKTRLAVAVGGRLQDRFGAGTALVPLDAVTDPGLVLAAIGRAAGADLAGTGSPLEALAETFGDGAWLLILDNLEQVVQVAPDLGELLARCPGWRCWPPAARRWGCGPSGSTRCRRCRCLLVRVLPRSRRWRPRRRWRCSWTGPVRCGPALP